MKVNGIDCEGIIWTHVYVTQGIRDRAHDNTRSQDSTVLYILPMVHFGNMSVGDVALSSCSDRADSPPGSFSARKQTVWLRQSVPSLTSHYVVFLTQSKRESSCAREREKERERERERERIVIAC